ncbi:MAG: hypothetical protein ACI4SG_02520 [Oligosphaeraceae bacterium]
MAVSSILGEEGFWGGVPGMRFRRKVREEKPPPEGEWGIDWYGLSI